MLLIILTRIESTVPNSIKTLPFNTLSTAEDGIRLSLFGIPEPKSQFKMFSGHIFVETE